MYGGLKKGYVPSTNVPSLLFERFFTRIYHNFTRKGMACDNFISLGMRIKS